MREETRAQIISSAIRLFAQHGYAHTSMRRIAGGAGISSGLSYHYFDSKEALLNGVFEHIMAGIDREILVVLTTTPVVGQAVGIVRTVSQMLKEEPDFWRLFYALRSQPAVDALLGNRFIEKTNALRSCLIASFEAQGHPNPTLKGYVAYCLIEGMNQQFLLDPEHYPLDDVVEEIILELSRQ